MVNRLIDPGSEFHVHRQWFDRSAMAELLEVDFAVAEKDRLYRCLDRILLHKQELFVHLRQRWQDLFEADFELLLYDLTSTYIEGEGEPIPKAKHGYSRDKRFDCRQLVIALVITPQGFPLAYEGLAGNTSERTTLRGFLHKIEATYGKARRVWLMDRGIPTEEVWVEMRDREPAVWYLVGTPRGKMRQYEKQWLDLPWQKVRESVAVKLFVDQGELFVLANSEGRRAKESALRRRRLARLLWKLRALRRSLRQLKAHEMVRPAGILSSPRRSATAVGREADKEGQQVRRQNFRFARHKDKLKKAELRDGHYLLRSHLVSDDPAVLWDRYVQLTQIEAAFKALKSELGLRPDLPPAGVSGGSPHSGGVPGLWPAGHSEEPAASARSGADTASGAGETGRH